MPLVPTSLRPPLGTAGLAAALLLALAVASAPAHAQSTAAGSARPAQAGAAAPAAVQDPHRRDDIVRHRAIAAAHETAARCLEGGQKESACHEALRKACEGIAVGRYCGMKHSH